jgi:hypothetical protein
MTRPLKYHSPQAAHFFSPEATDGAPHHNRVVIENTSRQIPLNLAASKAETQYEKFNSPMPNTDKYLSALHPDRHSLFQVLRFGTNAPHNLFLNIVKSN